MWEREERGGMNGRKPGKSVTKRELREGRGSASGDSWADKDGGDRGEKRGVKNKETVGSGANQRGS